MSTTRSLQPWKRRLSLATLLMFAVTAIPDVAAFAQQRSTRPASARRTEPKRETEKSDMIFTPVQSAEEPTDLAVRTLTDSMGTTSERKVAAAAPSSLTPVQIDRLRVADERIDNVIPFRGYPLSERLPAEKRSIFADASFGLYSTARIAAGYSGESWPFDYSASGRYMTTAGDPENGSLRQIAATLAGGYIIGDSYGIFSGGHMGARLHYGSDRYRLYATPAAPTRDAARSEVAMTGGNTWRGIRFDARGAYRSLELLDSASIDERSIDGSLELSQKLNEITVGGAADARWTTSRDTSISFAEIGAFVKYAFPAFSIQGGGSLAVAGESGDQTIVRLAPQLEARLHLAGAITATAGVHGGVTQNTLAGLLQSNPYTSSSYTIRHDIATFGYSAGLRIEPFRSLSLTAQMRNTEYEQYGYFGAAEGGVFAPRYEQATISTLDATFFWLIGENDELAALATYTRGTLDSPGRPLPYLPTIVTEASYRKRLAALPLTLTTHVRYIGEREGGGGETKSGVVLAGIEGRYLLTPQFDIALEFQNILNTSYELWDGYRERGLFAALGIKSRF